MTTSGLFASSRPWFSRYCHRSLNIGSWLVRIDVFACQEHVVAVIVGSSSGEFVAILLGCLQFGTQLIGLVHRWRQWATILVSRSLHSNDHSNCGGLVWLTYRFTWPNWSSPPPLTTPPKHQHSKTMTNTTKTFQDWLNTTHPFPDYVEVLGIRRGQWLSNKLHDCHPILVQQARKCGVDCYYDDSKIDRMITFAAVYWDNPHSASVK